MIFLTANGYREYNNYMAKKEMTIEDLVEMMQREFRALESLNKKKTHVWRNVNWLPEDDTFIGGKAGKTTAAGETMAGVFRVTFPEFEKRSVAIIVLQSKDRVSDVKKIIQYLAQNFVYGASSLVKGNNSHEQNSPIREGASVYEAVTNWVNKGSEFHSSQGMNVLR